MEIKDKFCVLFDMDGVLLDTESQYSIIWKKMGEKYEVGIEDFEQKIKGTTLPAILSTYFTHLSYREKNELIKELYDFEDKIEYRWINGAEYFVRKLRDNGIKTGLVTSSDNKKMASVYRQVDMRKIMDTIVSANRITMGKPDPMCYLLAAQDIGYVPEKCFVFEDSFAGLEAGKRAGMKVIGLATTHPEELLKGKCMKIIPDFSNFTIEKLIDLL